MDSVPRSSFIPKQTSGITPQRSPRKRVFSVLDILATILLIGSVLAAGGVFLYSYYLGNKLDTQKSDLTAEYNKFDDNEIATVQSADEQLGAARYLLDNHTSPSKIFDALEANTKESVQYTTFDYSRRPSGGVSLNITGVTSEFAKVSLQWTQYLEDVVLADVIMTQIGLGQDTGDVVPGKQVQFALTANIDAKNILYTASGNAVPEATPVESGAASSTIANEVDTASSSSDTAGATTTVGNTN